MSLVTGIHTASPFIFAIKDNVTDMLTPAIDGSSVLKAIQRYGHQVIAISPFAAVVDLAQCLRPGYTYTQKDWVPFTYEFAKDADIMPAYRASKTFAETSFDLAIINTLWVYGAHYDDAPALSGLIVSTSILWRLVDSAEVPGPDFLSFSASLMCGMLRPTLQLFEKSNAAERRFLVGTRFTYQDAVDLVRAKIP